MERRSDASDGLRRRVPGLLKLLLKLLEHLPYPGVSVGELPLQPRSGLALGPDPVIGDETTDGLNPLFHSLARSFKGM
jgi:hypothetical protein